jgi:hypothetical protein
MIRVKTWGVLFLLAALAWARPGFGFPADTEPRLVVEMLMGAGQTVNLNGRYWTSADCSARGRPGRAKKGCLANLPNRLSWVNMGELQAGEWP